VASFRCVPTELRGRAFALYDVLWNAARLVSLGLGGLLADALGIRAVYVLGGLLLLAAGAVGWSVGGRPPWLLVVALRGSARDTTRA